jgi:hypothetical protein
MGLAWLKACDIKSGHKPFSGMTTIGADTPLAGDQIMTAC